MRNIKRAARVRPMRTCCGAVLILTGMLASAAAPAGAQTSPTAYPTELSPPPPTEPKDNRQEWGEQREINGHRFLMPAFVENALVTSFIGMRTIGETENTPDLPLDFLGDIDVHQIHIAALLDLQVRIVKRIGLQLTLGAFGSTATTSRSLLARGGDYRGTIDGGVLFEIFRLRGPGTQLSARGSFGTDRGENLTLLPLIDSLNNAPIRTTREILRNRLDNLLLAPYSNVHGTLALALAQPFSKAFSLQASAGASIEDIQYDTYDVNTLAPTELELTRITPIFGLALTGDAMAINIPLALMLEYRLALPQTDNHETDETDSRDENTFGIGLYYSGRADMQTGFIVYAQYGSDRVIGRNEQGDPEESGRADLVGLRYMLRYFW
jgi:hypothetical protein